MLETTQDLLTRFGGRSPDTKKFGLSEPVLVEHALSRGEGHLGRGGALLVETGNHTGRSPKDKFVVATQDVEHRIWRDANGLMPESGFAMLLSDLSRYLEGKDLFVQDLQAGADENHAINVRIATEWAWHSLFARHLLRRTSLDAPLTKPDYLILDCPSFKARPDCYGCRTGTLIAVNFELRVVLIVGTGYAGEIKKSVFSLLNLIYPDRGLVSMHCAANHAIGDPSDSAIFFGLSGTGKTTLSADPSRTLIGDDEHAWSDEGIFNIEGGCYAKAINLSPQSEPEIYATTNKFGTVIENTVFDLDTRGIDFADNSKTENTRIAYPIDFIEGASRSGVAGDPKHIFMLTCDAFGVLPPIAKLTPAQAMYHFLSGFTAKIGGTEQGVVDPKPTFSACFAKPFLPLRPEVYASLLRKRIQQTGAACWLVNTGWTGGKFGVGNRMPLKVTRALLTAVQSGALAKEKFHLDQTFGLEVPIAVENVPPGFLRPRCAWGNAREYDAAAADVISMFAENFRQFDACVDEDVRSAQIGHVGQN